MTLRIVLNLILIFVQLINILFMFRITKVSRERHRVLDLSWKYLHRGDLEVGERIVESQNVLDQFEKYTFNEMIFKFWKPVDSFYKDLK